jgi:sulfopyruvate decarboxylase subunit beta
MPNEESQSRLGAGIPCEEALQVLAEARGDRQLVISNQMSARLWPLYSQHPLDFNYLSSTMGGAVPLGLGLALARPDLEVVVLSGDGSLLMNLGCLVSVTASGARNLTVILLDNGLYEVTGGQRTPGRLASVDFGQLARAAGFPFVREFDELDRWRAEASLCWDSEGPRLFSLQVHPVRPTTARCTTTRVDVELQRLRETLARMATS